MEQITEPLAQHGEGPVWYAGWPGLRWVDMLAGDVLELDPATQRVRRSHVGEVAAVVRPCGDGRALLAVERGFAIADPSLAHVRPLVEVFEEPALRMNEGGCDPDGRFYCGSMAYDERTGAGSLYRLDPDGTVTTVLTGVTVSNGFAFSPDGGTAYYIDSPTHRVDAFDYDPARGLTGRRTLLRLPAGDGAPDGMTVDADGRLWIALWGGSAVRCYTPGGRLEEEVPLPVRHVTACTFGGPDLDELYITTSRQGVPGGAEPEAGALFRYRPGVRGLPVLPFAAPADR
ncbi:SMP-30/gluconolactonase/LRE family protein [Amycolatopsis rhizosphaerae]|uniref:SMP-30/gluconolactonase/LRE family protein n=1 Tax=Amycolatopsis rhizosphaerae TaxID=2053003 RepID=A0A558DEA0_9PSEU|nr:SMP-30/gluconolactonase/LRE family protein [Amycolatopsis rhizosphaerae]TVT59354.1 SMP-30/gluconolactonase/LRE family protein [Amycolatopsis rhizosphaerae]